MAWYYNVTGSSTPPTANDYHYYGLNSNNQEAAWIYMGAAQAVTKIRVYASARTSAVYTRLAIWAANTYVAAQTDTFTMATGSDSVGGQAWQEITLPTPYVVPTSDNYMIGLYRNPSGAHIGGTHTSIDSELKTNTNGFPSIVSMYGSTQDTGEGLLVGVFFIGVPAATTGATVTRNSDTSQTISFTNNATTDNPYDGIYLYRYDNVTGDYYKIATLSSGATSYTDTTTQANRYYRYYLLPYNCVGNATSNNYSNYINTTPSAPSNVVAASSGTNVNVTWTDNSTNEHHFNIQSSEYTGGAWQAWVQEAEVAAGSTSWTDTSPPNIVKYQVKALTDTDESLSSAYVVSNSLTILQAPNAPSNLSPDGSTLDGGVINVFTWTHNPLDGSPQTKYSIQYKLHDGSYPGTPQVNETASSTSSHSFAASTFTQGEEYKYQVKTWGSYSTGSAWSAEKTFYTSTPPVGTITSPTAPADYASSILTLTWSYSDAEANAQVQYLANLYDSNDTLLETKTASSAVTSVVFATSLSNGTDYKVDLRVQDSTGLWSTLNEVSFNTVFAVPPTPTIVLTKSESTGSVQIAITNPSPEGAEIEAVSNDVYRSVDGGVNYVKFLTGVPLNTTVTDYLPLLGSSTYYCVAAVSGDDTIALSVVSYVTLTCGGYYFLNTGSDYGTYMALYRETNVNEVCGYETIAIQFEGRTYKTRYTGNNKVDDITFSCEILSADLATLKALVETTTDMYYRDYTGRWFICAILNPSFNKKDYGRSYVFSCNIIRLEGDV